MPNIRNLDSAETVSLSTSTSIPKAKGIIIAVEDDAVTPTDHAWRLYDAAQQPKKIIVQRHTAHYSAYQQYGNEVGPESKKVSRR